MRRVAAMSVGLLCLAVVGQTVNAAPVVVDFESFNLGGGLFLDTPETLTFPSVGGSGITMQVLGNDDLRIYDLLLFGGYAFPGPQALIDMNWSTFDNPQGTDITFDGPVMNFSLIAGDFGSDDDSPLRIEAFDASDASLGIATASWPFSAFPPFQTLSLNVTGIRRVHYSSGGAFQSSTFIDDITFTPVASSVPEPAALVLVVPGLVALGGASWRRGRRG